MTDEFPDEYPKILYQHMDRAEAWLADGFGDRLDEGERGAIICVLFDRAWQCKSEMDADALRRAVERP